MFIFTYIYIFLLMQQKMKTPRNFENTKSHESGFCSVFAILCVCFFSRFCRASMGPRKRGRGKIRWPSMSSHRIFPYPFWTIPEPLVPDIIPVYFISFLRLATEQHSTLLQKVGINGKVYLLNKMNNFTSSRPTLWLKSSRNCSGG